MNPAELRKRSFGVISSLTLLAVGCASVVSPRQEPTPIQPTPIIQPSADKGLYFYQAQDVIGTYNKPCGKGRPLDLEKFNEWKSPTGGTGGRSFNKDPKKYFGEIVGYRSEQQEDGTWKYFHEPTANLPVACKIPPRANVP